MIIIIKKLKAVISRGLNCTINSNRARKETKGQGKIADEGATYRLIGDIDDLHFDVGAVQRKYLPV